MSLPDYQLFMLPFLECLADGQPRHTSEIQEYIAVHLKISDQDRSARFSSGNGNIFKTRMGWSRTYLKKAGLIDYPQRGIYKITMRGKNVLNSPPSKIDIKYLSQFNEFKDFLNSSKPKSNFEQPLNLSESTESDSTPQETLEIAYEEIRKQLADELIEKISSCSPSFFEQLVVDLIVKLGYGGSRQDAGERLGQSGDEGIDGIIKEDRLGLDTIYLQAKRWKDTVIGRPEIQKFVGALQGQRARKGVFITTSFFTKEAIEYVKNIDIKVVLLDGKQLSELMIDFDVGVNATASYQLKRIDLDYFEES